MEEYLKEFKSRYKAYDLGQRERKNKVILSPYFATLPYGKKNKKT
jgi:hypothetical protein